MSASKPKTLFGYFASSATGVKKRDRDGEGESVAPSPAKASKTKDVTDTAAAYTSTAESKKEEKKQTLSGANTCPVIISPEGRIDPMKTTAVRPASPVYSSISNKRSESSECSSSHSSSSSDSNDTSLALVSELREPSWQALLGSEFRKPYFQSLLRYVEAEMRRHTIFPPRDQVFAAFNACPVDQIKVVILGQDPYHGPGQAHGLAFSVQRGVPPPPSLKNIFKVAQEDVNIPKPTHGNLTHWSQQGVLLLNTCLTVRSGQAFSHQNKGWEDLVDCVIRLLATRRDGLVFMLWGKPAQARCKNIDRSRHYVITSSHPSPLGAAKTDEPFLSSRCFSRCNERLRQGNQRPIDWTIPK